MAVGECGGGLHADDGGMPMSVMTTVEIITDSVNSDSTPRDMYEALRMLGCEL